MADRTSARTSPPRGSRGYSLIEILVVIAIIGTLSLVTVPAFMNYQRRNAVRSGLRFFTSDLRSFRQLAISKNAYVRVQFLGPREYALFQSRDLGTTWKPLLLGAVQSTSHVRHLPETVAFTANTFNDSDTDGDVDIDFRPDGTVGDFAGSAASGGTITMRTEWKEIINQVVIELRTTGQIKSTESKS